MFLVSQNSYIFALDFPLKPKKWCGLFFERASTKKIFEKKFAKNLQVKKNVVPLHSEMVNADVAQLARAADL